MCACREKGIISNFVLFCSVFVLWGWESVLKGTNGPVFVGSTDREMVGNNKIGKCQIEKFREIWRFKGREMYISQPSCGKVKQS